MKVTNRRVNALENVTIPKIQGVLDYIDRELDELEREDFTRLKLVQSKKEIQMEEERKLREDKGVVDTNNDHDIMVNFDAGDDEDVVF
jgi:V-type H+-transporting ATPase subunit D